MLVHPKTCVGFIKFPFFPNPVVGPRAPIGNRITDRSRSGVDTGNGAPPKLVRFLIASAFWVALSLI